MMTLSRDLTPREEQVVDLLARGIPNKRIALALTISIRTVEGHIDGIAQLLPNPDTLPARTLVMLWAAHRAWMRSLYRSRAA